MGAQGKGVYQVKVTLSGIRPPIWRRLLISPEATFQDLHRVIQIAMGWRASHLHLFQAADGRLIGDPAEDEDDMMGFLDETRLRVGSVLKREGQAIKYEYDFGDSWEHQVKLEKILPAGDEGQLPHCIKAARQCPPEDVGGVHGYYEFLDAMHDPAHPEHEGVKEWWGGEFDPEFVNLEEINQLLPERDALFAESEVDALPPADFCGLSPSQMHELLQSPLHCPSVFKPLINAKAVDQELDTAPILEMAKVLVNELGEKGIRLTGKGNLPLKQVKAMIEAAGEEVVVPFAGYGSVRSEEDILGVQLTRVLLELAGYTRKEKGRLLLKKAAAKRIHTKGWLTLYQDMLAATFSEFNWAWMDHYDGLDDIQTVGPFFLWLLAEKGGDWLPVDGYINDMLAAFPQLPLSAHPRPYASEEQQTRWALNSRVIRLFRLLGLIELNPERVLFREEAEQRLRRTALFEGLFAKA
ncbi:plasmid pRiA4b ORF-3 family protein [Marinobacter shengliensis]|uniref:plasmid pRiA4b ORF-3 family protein n=1 Tax=Marinobacter TaxID=2742 RepID=UPI001E369DD3|nr:plasmid pRiA4b ORF-3 family protein [Marinobacter shengliensis]MCD1630794.1 plasmid pRiA4b ORF-3 family protein [Marinobacter shengliensis]